MKLFSNSVIGGTIAWRIPFRLEPGRAAVTRSGPPPDVAEPIEFDEEGRRFVFRYRAASPPAYTVDRDRLFDYMRSKRLPTEADRSFRRDVRNQANFFEDVRDLQTHGDVETSQ